MIQKNRLLNFNNNVIYQNDDWFKFSLDSVLLINFVTIRLNDKNILDLCSGNAPIPMLLTHKTKAKIYGIEIQKEIYDLGLKSIIDNKMDKQISFINDDIRNANNLFNNIKFDVVLSNPPYFKVDENSLVNDNEIKSVARHEIKVDLDTVLNVASSVLRSGGTFAMVHRPERLVEIIDDMRRYNIEPKKIQFVHPKKISDSNMVLIEGKKNGNPGLKILKPLIVSKDDGEYNDNIKKYYQE